LTAVLRHLWAFAPALAVLALCPAVALLSADAQGPALEHARALADFERSLGLYVEPELVSWASGRETLLWLAGAIYLGVHVPALGGALVLVYLHCRGAFARVQAVFVVCQLGLAASWLAWPLAPPHLLAGGAPGLGGPWDTGASAAAGVLQSSYAAMPSGHVVFALLAAWTIGHLALPRVVRRAAWLYPALVAAITLVTANHFWLDAVGAAVLVGTVVGGVSAAATLASGGGERLELAVGGQVLERPALERPQARG